MDFSKLLNAIRGSKAADASAAPKNRPADDKVIPVEVAPTVLAADHPPPTRPSGGVVQSILSPLTDRREPSPPPPSNPPVLQPAGRYADDVLASVLPTPSSPPPPVDPKPPTGPPPAEPLPPSLEGDWFDVSLEPAFNASSTVGEAEGAVLDLPLEEPPVSGAMPQAELLGDALLMEPTVAPPADPFEVSGQVDLSWSPVEATSTPTAFPYQAVGGDGLPVVTPNLNPASPSPVPPPGLDPLADFAAVGHSSPPDFLPTPDAPVTETAVAPTYPVDETPHSTDASFAFVAAAPPSYADWLLDNLDEAIILLDADGVIHRMNPMAEYLLGCPRTLAHGQTLLDISRRLDGENALLWEHLAVTADAQQFSASVTLPDGQSMMASFVVMALPPQDAWPGGRVIAVRDETRLRAEIAQTMEELAAASSSALMVTPEQLTAMRTSLQMVLGFAELLHRGEYGPMNPQQFEMFRNIEHHAKQLAEWIGLPQS
ncbi:MAG: PAS domain-containing protein [Chloracidobacterium sp.]|nr:PAS domain-containing protein [Chloracidobacterium sp.]MDW8217596.1 PAS domain-containing protein [Acidobacteriota bacterium]